MPRPNPPRALQSEANLARRIAYEREERGWTYEGTAKRLTDAGCAIQGSAIYKIEKGDPPRRISVDELVAFSAVFGLPVADLLLPADVIADRALHAAIDRLSQAEVAFREAEAVRKQTSEEVMQELKRLNYHGAPWVFDPDLGRFVTREEPATAGSSGRRKK